MLRLSPPSFYQHFFCFLQTYGYSLNWVELVYFQFAKLVFSAFMERSTCYASNYETKMLLFLIGGKEVD